MIFPLLGPPRDPARTYHSRRLHDVSEPEWAVANSKAPETFPSLLRFLAALSLEHYTVLRPNRELSGLRQDSPRLAQLYKT